MLAIMPTRIGAENQRLRSKSWWSTAQWPQNAPLPAPFSVEWEGVLRIANYGAYQFFLRTPKNAELYIGEQKVLAGEGELSDGVVLAKGNHNIRLRALSGEGQISLSWKPPDGDIGLVPASALYGTPMRVNGLLGRYFANGDWQSPESFAQIDPSINFYFHNIPLPRPYTVEWSGKIAIPASGIMVLVWNRSTIRPFLSTGRNWSSPMCPIRSSPIRFRWNKGCKTSVYRYADRTDHTHINLYWTPPNFASTTCSGRCTFSATGKL